MFSLQMAAAAVDAWAMQCTRVRRDVLIQGSPERCMARAVIVNAQGEPFLLEQLPPEALDLKIRIASRLQRLFRSGLAVVPYCKGINGEFIQHVQGCNWQLSPYLSGIALDRRTYWQDGWRGAATARFLTALSRATSQWPLEAPIFSPRHYINKLISDISAHDPDHLPKVTPIVHLLEKRLFPMEDSFEWTFNHGDPHPLNIIWDAGRIKAVIDWEFCGWKPALYDAALVIGCVGAEAPQASSGAFVQSFCETMGANKLFTKDQWDVLPLLILAVRFGWLSEWLRRNDREMVAFELFYMDRLMRNCGG